MNKIYTFVAIFILIFTITGCAVKDFAMEDEWNDGYQKFNYLAMTASTEMVPEFTLDTNATFAILNPKSSSIKEQKILYTLRKSFNADNKVLTDDIKKAKYILAYSETLQKSTRMYSVPTFYSTYTNFTDFSGLNVSATSYSTGSKTQFTTDYYNIINLSLFEWKNGKLSIVWGGDTVVDTEKFKTQYSTYTELLYKLLGKETKGNNVVLKVNNEDNTWTLSSY